MHETPDDLTRLQALLDASYADAGPHLKSIATPERLLTAAELAERLSGVQVLALATVTADGRPLVSPVDGLFYRGEWWFGSADNSIRFRHVRARPPVSASHHRGERLAVVVHGRAEEIDTADAGNAGFRDYCTETYGEGWLEWTKDEGVAYARIHADKLFAFGFEPEAE